MDHCVDIEFIVRVNGLFRKSLNIQGSVSQGCPLSALLYVLTLELLLPSLEEIGGTANGLCCGCGAKAYSGAVSIILSDENQLANVAGAIRRYEAVAGLKILLGTWRRRALQSDSVVDRWKTVRLSY